MNTDRRAYGFPERAEAAQNTATVLSVTGITTDQERDDLFRWFLAAVTGARLRIIVGTTTYPQGGYPGSPRSTTRTPNGALLMKDTEQVHASLEFDDAKGFATVDPNAVSWSVDDTSVCSAQPDSDGSGGCTFVAGNPGSTVATVTDGVVSGTVAIDVTAGDVASIKVAMGDPEPQPAPSA